MAVIDSKPASSDFVPTSIEKHSTTEMIVKWNNGETSIIPFVDLRYFCRCAECVDEWTRKRKLERKNIKPDIKPMAVELVGRYALQISWSDGHKAGIYPFEQVYEIALGRAE